MHAEIDLEEVDRRIRRWLASGLGARWVVAVSGGSDSVGLLRKLHAISEKVGLTLSVAHLNHQVRGAAALEDAALVSTLAESLNLPFDLGQWQPSRPGHFEADARRARYIWLASIARDRGASAVAVGHTYDDQAETILHRLLRGTGPRGLGGIRARRPLGEGITLVRPLLKISRQDLHNYLASMGQPFRDDLTNLDRTHTRARIRHDLLPKLEREYNPRVADALVRLGDLTRAAQAGLDQQTRAIERETTLSSSAGSIALDRQRLAMLTGHLRAEVIRLAWRNAGWPEASMSADRWRRLAVLVRRPTGRISVGAGVEAEVRGALLVLSRCEPIVETIPEPRRLDVPGAVEWCGGRIFAAIDPETHADEIIDRDQLDLPLTVRAPKAGDRFEPLGMDGQGMALNDFFRGRRIARDARAKTPLVCDAKGIIWVAGHRIAHRVRVRETTSRRIRLTWDLKQ